MTTTIRTRVAIVGAGPAGLMLSHLLADAGIESVVIDRRSRAEIERTIRAGILEQGTVDLLVDSGVSTACSPRGTTRRHRAALRRRGPPDRLPRAGRPVGLAVPADTRCSRTSPPPAPRGRQDRPLRGHRRRGARPESARPRRHLTDAAGERLEIDAEVVVGADGSHGIVRRAITGGSGGGYFREYPFAWFGILCEAPPSTDELIYSSSRPRLRPDQPAQRHGAADVLPVRSRRATPRTGPTSGSGTSCRSASPARRFR